MIESVINASHSTKLEHQAAGCRRKEEQSLTERSYEAWCLGVPPDQREMAPGYLEGTRTQTHRPGDSDGHLQKDHRILGFRAQPQLGESHRARTLAWNLEDQGFFL